MFLVFGLLMQVFELMLVRVSDHIVCALLVMFLFMVGDMLFGDGMICCLGPGHLLLMAMGFLKHLLLILMAWLTR